MKESTSESVSTAPETKKENWFITLVFWPFRTIASLLSALSMDDKGFSMKKILASFGTYKAANFTSDKLSDSNVEILVLMWILYSGILVGIYSIGDITSALSVLKKGTNDNPTLPVQ